MARPTGLELLEHCAQVGRALHLAIAFLAQSFPVGLCVREFHLDLALPRREFFPADPFAHRLPFPLVPLDPHPFEVLLRLAEGKLSLLRLVRICSLRIERPCAQLFQLGMQRVRICMRLDEFGLERLDGLGEVVVGGAQVGDLLFSSVEFVLAESRSATLYRPWVA